MEELDRPCGGGTGVGLGRESMGPAV
jgi:hypothetical protein